MHGGQQRVAVEQIAVAGELFDAVDAAVALDFDGHVLAVAVNRHDVDRSDGCRVFAAHELRAFADAFDLFGQVLLQMVFDAVLDEARILAEVVRFVRIDVLQRHFQRVDRFVGRRADHLLRHFSINVVIGVVGGDVPDAAWRGHPVERLV